MNLAQNGMFINASIGGERAFMFHQGSYKALQSLLRGFGKRAAEFHALKGGYAAKAVFKGAWSPLPEGFENFTLSQVQQFLASHDIKLPPEPVTDLQVNGIDQLDDDVFIAVNGHDKHDAARADVCDGAGLHAAPLVDADAAIVTTGGAA